MNRDSGAYSLTDLSDNAAPGATNDDRLDQALAEYLTLAQSGSSPDIPALLQKYDDVADKLAGCLKTLKFMHFVGESVSRAPDAKATPALMDDALGERPVNRTLGGHEIVREIGRGGMGVVYEAREIMLDRIVALKVLPFAALSDERHLKRFKNEARAAGTLDHPNIVAIHAVGSDRGIHYYTMKYIDGPTLAEVISALRSSDAEGDGEYLAERTTGFPAGLSASGDAPPVPHTRPPTGSTDTRREIQADLSTRRSTSKAAHYQTVARWGIEAAEALAYAHENGVLHRDIKPGNLLVDENGKLWVTDFGLARLEKDASMTMTGDIVGTLRYMAPEQALAKRIPIDHRTDVYSLGVTLYELLTLRPAITGDDRRELLKKIAFEDPPPPRKVDASIPIELETIVVKAMAKNPDERYCSAQELADDLQRYLDDKPIVARPPNLLDRTAKWARRHQSFVWTMLAVSALLIIGLSIGSILFANAAQRASLAAQLATHEKEEALRNLYRANVQIALNEWDDGRVDFALQHLAAVRPKPGGTDHRCWEWYYVQSLCHQGEPLGGYLVDAAPSCPLQLLRRKEKATHTFTDLDSGEVRLVVAEDQPFPNHMWDFTLDPKGRYLAFLVGYQETSNRLLVYDLHSRQKLWEKTLTTRATNFDWSPDGNRMVTRQSNDRLAVWDIDGGALILEIQAERGIAKWSPDGRWIVCGTRVWNATTGTPEPDWRIAGWGTTCWDPHSQRIAINRYERLTVWAPGRDKPLFDVRSHHGGRNFVEWSPEGKTIATGGGEGIVKTWDALTGQLLNEFRGHTHSVYSVRWMDGGRRLASTCRGRQTLIWDPTGEQGRRSLPGNGAVAWMDSGPLVVRSADQSRGTYDVVDVFTGAITTSITHDDADADLSRAAFDRAGHRLAAGYEDGTIRMWDTSNNRLLFSLDGHRHCNDVVWKADDSLLASSGDDGVKVWNADTGELVAQINHGLHPDEHDMWLGWSPDGGALVGNAGRTVFIWDTDDWREIHRLKPGDAGGGGHLSWSPAGARFVMSSGELVNIWEAKTGRNLMHVKASNTDITGVAWSPDGTRIATAAEDHVLKIWNAETGEDMLTLREPTFSMSYLAWSADGRKLAAVDAARREVRIWDASRGYQARN